MDCQYFFSQHFKVISSKHYWEQITQRRMNLVIIEPIRIIHPIDKSIHQNGGLQYYPFWIRYNCLSVDRIELLYK